ncbi:MAG: flagellar hook-associated protein FlgL [Desulfovibrio sp.]
MRVSDNQIYSSALSNMNESLSNLMHLNMQNSSQKKMLLPSDNPTGMATALNLHSHNGALTHFLENVKSAQGWLNLGDNVLGEASKAVIKITELAQQASTGTYDYDQRLSIAKQMRQMLGSLMNQANTRFADKSIFAGHKVEVEPFRPILGATMLDENLKDSDLTSINGSALKSVRVEFTSTGVVGGVAPLNYKYSTDAGKTWKTGALAAGSTEVDLGTCKATLKNGIGVTAASDKSGTRFNIRPAIEYLGDDSDGVDVIKLTESPLATSTTGKFAARVNVRIDNSGALPGPVKYSFSTDGGSSWVTGNVSTDGKLAIPGGTLNLTNGTGNTFKASDQFAVAPNTADISLSLSRTQSVVVNNVGKDVFGGMYKKPGDTSLTKAMPDSPEKNLFETVGRLIGAVETNDVNSIGEALADLKKSHAYLESVNATVGGRVNLTDFVLNSLNMRKDNNNAYLSNIESADISEIMSNLKKSELVYTSVIQTNKIIMELNSISVI